MKKLILSTVFVILALYQLNAQNYVRDKSIIATEIAARNTAVHVFEDWTRDPYIVIGPNNKYYLTYTNLDNDFNKLRFPILESDNLVDWTLMGRPYSLMDLSYWNSFDKNDLKLWAPELHYVNNKWVVVHTTSNNYSAIAISQSTDSVPLKLPVSDWGTAFGKKHDPNLLQDDDGKKWLIWGATNIQEIKSDLTGLTGSSYSIKPSDRKIGHEGSQLIKVGKKYVLFGTGWSTDNMRSGTYNLYYCTADKITGPYGVRRFAGRCLGHGTVFQDKAGKWWCTAFSNGDYMSPENVVKNGVSTTTATSMNKSGLTLVPMDIQTINGDVWVRSLDPNYAIPGNEEVQKFNVLWPKETATPKTEKKMEWYNLIQNNNQLTIYLVQPDFTGAGLASLYNLSGQIVGHRSIFGNSLQFSTENLTPGVYVLQIQAGKQMERVKIAIR